MRSWNTYVNATDTQGRTGTVETPICADTETEAATTAIQAAQNNGYTPTDGRVSVEPTSNCRH